MVKSALRFFLRFVFDDALGIIALNVAVVVVVIIAAILIIAVVLLLGFFIFTVPRPCCRYCSFGCLK